MALFHNPWGKGAEHHDKWFKNPWGSDGKYFGKGTGGDEDSDQNQINLTKALMDSPVYQVYERLLENSIFQKYLAPFKDEAHNLSIDFIIMPSNRELSAETDTKDESNIIITINGNYHFYQNKVDNQTGTYIKKPADIYIAKTLIHELMHAYITAKDIKYTDDGTRGPVREHQYMALNMREDIVNCLTEFADENNINITSTNIDAISWAGLDSTSAWSTKLMANVQTTYAEIFNRYSTQIYWFGINGSVLQDDMTKYGGNLPTSDIAFAQHHIPKE